ncbi:hypothetical protein IQ07DRAFT_585450 [Pyrenochaeta sp. DS3sAY3a]|nr:hypothetical protein IQ07DRAFT_585450 [Pyrenochaeta sp. DS3sAY3a]
MSNTNKTEQAVAYAALILADESIAITPEKLQTLLKAAGIEDVEPIWTTLFANALKDKDVKEILTTVAATGPAVGGEGPDRGSFNDTDCEDNDDGFDDTVTLFEGESSDDEVFCSMFD